MLKDAAVRAIVARRVSFPNMTVPTLISHLAVTSLLEIATHTRRFEHESRDRFSRGQMIDVVGIVDRRLLLLVVLVMFPNLLRWVIVSIFFLVVWVKIVFLRFFLRNEGNVFEICLPQVAMLRQQDHGSIGLMGPATSIDSLRTNVMMTRW